MLFDQILNRRMSMGAPRCGGYRSNILLGFSSNTVNLIVIRIIYKQLLNHIIFRINP
jgi:hypothetical protein